MTETLRATKFAMVPEWVYTAVDGQAIRVYCVLVQRAQGEGSAFPSRKAIATKLGVSKNTVDRAIDALVEVKALVVARRKNDGGAYTSNEYRIRFDAPRGGPTDGECQSAEGGPTDGESLSPNMGSLVSRSNTESSSIELLHASDAHRLCVLLAELMVANGCKRPNVTDAWIRDMDRLIRLDGRTPEQVEAAIRWCQGDAFWQANIHSPATLRKQYDKLRLAAKRDRTPTRQQSTIDALQRLYDSEDDGYTEGNSKGPGVSARQLAVNAD